MDVLGFTGVPVFQAEGLTVKTEKARYTPLFLSKVRDRDAACCGACCRLQQPANAGSGKHSLCVEDAPLLLPSLDISLTLRLLRLQQTVWARMCAHVGCWSC